MATENLLMAAVQAGGDRQDLHERIRTHSLAAAERLKQGAGHNDLIERLRDDPAFPPVDYSQIMDPRRFIGRAPDQVVDFIERVVKPIRDAHPNLLRQRGEVYV